MFDNYYIIEIRSRSAGIKVQAGLVVRDGRGFRFFAATHAFDHFDGQLFANPKAAERAALNYISKINSAERLKARVTVSNPLENVRRAC